MIRRLVPATFSSSVSTPSRINSYFGRANYSLMDKYLLTLTFRADGSSKFAPASRWGYFPAAAVAWKPSDESFMKKIDWLDNLKVRVSYGQVGNDGISSNLWSQSWGSVTDQRYQYAINGATPVCLRSCFFNAGQYKPEMGDNRYKGCRN